MGRKSKYPKEQCGKILQDGSICGELSYVRPVLSDDGRRTYKRWHYIKLNEGQPKTHYKGPADPHRRRGRPRKSEADRIGERRFYNPISKARLRMKPQNFEQYAVLLKNSFLRLYFDFQRYYEMFEQLLIKFPLSKPPHVDIKRLYEEGKIPYDSYEWKPGAKEKADLYRNQWLEEYARLKRIMNIAFMRYHNALLSQRDSNLSDKDKDRIYYEAFAIFENVTQWGEIQLDLWRSILKHVTDNRSVGSFMDWCKIARDRFEDTIGGASKHNAALTGFYIMRLGKIQEGDEYPKSVQIVPVARKLSTKHIDHRTFLEFPDNEITITCKCGNEIHGKKIPDEVRDSMGLDFYTQVISALEKDPLSNYVEIAYNNPITEIRRSPQDFYVEQIKKIYKKTPSQEEIDNLEVKEVESEIINMEEKNIDNYPIRKYEYSMKNSIVGRGLRLSSILSDKAFRGGGGKGTLETLL